MSASPGGETAAQAYERLLVPALFAPSAERAVALADVVCGDRVVDVACGTAIGLRAAARRAGSLGEAVGIDSDADMAHAARAALAAHGVRARVLVAPAAQLPLADAVFDLVLCLQGLQFFDDRVAALRGMRRVLAPGGRLVITAWAALDHVPGHRAVYEALDAQGIDTASPRRGFALSEPRALLEGAALAGFVDARVEVETREARFASTLHFVEGLFQGAPYTRRVMQSLPEPERRRCAEAACRRLQPFESADGLKLPLRNHILVAHARA